MFKPQFNFPFVTHNKRFVYVIYKFFIKLKKSNNIAFLNKNLFMFFKSQFLKLILLSIFSLFSVIAFGQTTITSQNFEALPAGLGYTVSNSNYVNIDNTYGDASMASLRFSNNNGSNNRNSKVTFNTIDISAYSNITVTLSFASYKVDNYENLIIDFSYDGGGFTDQQKLIDGQTGSGGETWNWGTPDNDGGVVNSNPYTFAIPNGYSTLAIRVRAKKLDDNEYFYIDNLIVKSNYCTSSGNTDFETGITLVSFNTINNATDPLKTNGYEDFTALSTNVILGSTHNLTVNVNTDGNYTNNTFAWIDWNQNGDFNDIGESYNLGMATNVSNGSTTNSPFVITIPATASIGSTRMRVATRYSSNPTPCETSFDGEVEDYTINIMNASNIWNGALSSDWNDFGNWSVGVPTIGVPNTLNVILPNGLTNYPAIFSGDTFGYVNDILIESNTTLNIIDNYLQITGTLTLNGIIDLEGKSQLLQDIGSVLDVTSIGSIEIDQQGNGNSFRYNYWSSPVNSADPNYTIGGVLRDDTDPITIKNIDFGAAYTYADGAVTSPIKLSTYWMYKLEDSGLGYSAWVHVGKDIPIKIGQGFTMKGSNTSVAEQNYTFVGKPNNGTINLPVNSNNDYLVGNPYPSAIDSWQFIDDNSPLGTASIGNGGTLYFWEHYGGDTHNLKDYQGGYATLSKGGSTPASSNVPAGVSTLGSSVKGAPGRYIPIGQAFFVVGSTTGGDIQFNNGQRIFMKEASGVSVFMKSNASKSKIVTTNKTDLRPKFRIGFDAPKINHRQLLLTIDKNTTDAIDWGYDAEMYDIVNDDMYWAINDKKYVIQAINTLNLDKEITLGIHTKEGGTIRIMVDALENVDKNTSIYIKDNLTGETYNITNQTFEINLKAGEYNERFVVTFQPSLKTLKEVALIEGVHIFMNNNVSELQLNRIVDTDIEDVSLFNYLGQQVKTWNINTDKRFISLPIQIATGVYIAQVHTTAGIITKKIIIE